MRSNRAFQASSARAARKWAIGSKLVVSGSGRTVTLVGVRGTYATVREANGSHAVVRTMWLTPKPYGDQPQPI